MFQYLVLSLNAKKYYQWFCRGIISVCFVHSMAFAVPTIALQPIDNATQKAIKTINPVIKLPQVRPSSKSDCAYKVLTTAYKSIGYDIELVVLTPKKALVESNAGRIDGEVARIAFIEQDYPNLVRVPVTICSMAYKLYSKKSLKLESYQQLNSLRFGIRKGVLYLEKTFRRFKPKSYNSNRQLIELLLQDRLDVITMSENVLRRNTSLSELAKFRKSKLKLPKVPLYHYLHKKNAALLPKITEALKELQQSGFIKEAIKNHQP